MITVICVIVVSSIYHIIIIELRICLYNCLTTKLCYLSFSISSDLCFFNIILIFFDAFLYLPSLSLSLSFSVSLSLYLLPLSLSFSPCLSLSIYPVSVSPSLSVSLMLISTSFIHALTI